MQRKTDSDFAVEPLLEILELLFFIALDTLSIHVRCEKLKAFYSQRTFSNLDDCLIA